MQAIFYVERQLMKPEQPNQQQAGFLSDLQSEISAESAPLLQFFIKNAGWIAGSVILLLIILCGMAVWNWHQTSKLDAAKNELASINLKMQGAEKQKALETLVANVPDSLKIYIYMELGQTARENGNTELAIQSYTKAAELGESSSMGFAAQLGKVALLMEKGDYADALATMRKISNASPGMAQSPQFLQILAEVALKAKDNVLARQTYETLAAQSSERQAEYYREKIKNLDKTR